MKRIFLALVPIFFIASFWYFIEENRQNFPDPVASHWGFSGDPDGFSSLNGQLLISVLVLGLVALIWLALFFVKPIPMAVRTLIMAVVGLIWLMLYALFFFTFFIQLGLTDASQARLSIWVILGFVAVPVLLVPWLLAKPQIGVGEKLTVRYWGISLLSVNYADLEEVAEGSVRAFDFGGWGVRYANKTTAFIPSSGKALGLKLATGERILIRTDSASELVELIDQRRGLK